MLGKAITFMNQVQHNMSDLVLQVYLGPTGEKQLYNVSMTTVTGQHECSPTILQNKMVTTVMNIGIEN